MSQQLSTMIAVIGADIGDHIFVDPNPCSIRQLGSTPGNSIFAPRDLRGKYSPHRPQFAKRASLRSRMGHQATELAHFLCGLVEDPMRAECVVGPGGLEPPTRPL